MSESNKDCEFCNKVGLPILPVRCAPARKTSDAPQIDASLGGDALGIDLGEKAYYTARQLRSGYLYVYDEARDRWDGYFVTQDGYFFKLELGMPTPPLEDMRFSCDPGGDGLIASTITIPDADNATKVWFAFSDVEWTDAVFARHADESVRQKHMRSLNVAAWLGSHTHAHAQPIDILEKSVAEYAIGGGRADTQFAWSPARMWSKAMWCSSLKDAYEDLSPGNGMILMLDDGPGMAMELAALMHYERAQFLSDPSRARSLALSSSIASLKQLKKEQAVQQEIAAGESLARDMENRNHMSGTAAAMMGGGYSSDASIERMRTPTKTNLDKARDSAWDPYINAYHEDQLQAFDKKFEADLKTLENHNIRFLAEAHAAWLGSDIALASFEHNFDPSHIGHGVVYEKLLIRCVEDTADKKACRDLYLTWLNGAATDRRNPLIRALVLDNDDIASQVEANANSNTALSDINWTLVFAAYAKAFEKVAEIPGRDWLAKAARSDALTQFVFHLGGPLTKVFDDGLQTETSTPGLRRLAIASGARVGRPVIEVTVEGGKKAFRAELIRQLYAAHGNGIGSQNKIQRAVAARLRQLEAEGIDLSGTQARRWLLLIDEDLLRNLPDGFDDMSGQQRARWVADTIKTPEDLGRLTRAGWRGMLNSNTRLAAVAFLLQGVSMLVSLGDEDQLMEQEKTESSLQAVAASSLLMGTVGDMLGSAAEATAWGQIRFGQGLGNKSVATALKFGGRALGSIGGFIMAGIDFKNAYQKAMKGNFGMASLYAVSGTVGGVFAGAILFGAAWLTGGVAILFILLLIGLSVFIGHFKKDDIQEWLERCEWGKLSEDQHYDTLEEEQRDLKAALS